MFTERQIRIIKANAPGMIAMSARGRCGVMHRVADMMIGPGTICRPTIFVKVHDRGGVWLTQDQVDRLQLRDEDADQGDLAKRRALAVLNEDLKPRGEKPQFWLAVRPSTIKAVEDGEIVYWTEALEDYLEVSSAHYAKTLARSLMGALVDWGHAADEYAALCLAVGVFEYGANKYAPGNFRRAFADMESMRKEYTSAIMRHMFSAQWGG